MICRLCGDEILDGQWSIAGACMKDVERLIRIEEKENWRRARAATNESLSLIIEPPVEPEKTEPAEPNKEQS